MEIVSTLEKMDKAVRKQGMELEVCDLSILVAEAMGIKMTNL